MQLKRLFAFKAADRQAKLEKLNERRRAREAELARLRDPAVRCTTFSGLKLLQNTQLIEQLKIRKVVDGRTESTGKPLITTPPPQGGRTWLVLRLQELLKLEWKEKKLLKNPNDLKKGDLGCVSRAPRKQRATRAPAEKAPKGGGTGRKRKASAATWDEEEQWPVEAILEKRIATEEDAKINENMAVGDVLYLVAWEGWEPSYNS